MTMFGTVWPSTKLTFDDVGRPTPVGQTVRNDASLGSVTVTFSATAPTPDAGTPPRPPMDTGRSTPPTRTDPCRVSSTRAGVSAWKALPAGNHPITSTTTSTLPLSLYTSTRPSWPTLAMTMFGTSCPLTKLRFEAVGRASPEGQTVTKDGAVGFVAVTFKATATAPVGGTPPRPTTSMLIDWSVPIRPPFMKRPSIVGLLRVSAMRAGVRPLKAWPAGTQPRTSITTLVVPALLNSEIWPFSPTFVSTELATVRPAVKLRFDAYGCGEPVGHTVR